MSYNDSLKTENIPVPVCTINRTGLIISINSMAENVLDDFTVGDNLFAITSVNLKDIDEALEGGPYPIIKRGDRAYKLVTCEEPKEGNAAAPKKSGKGKEHSDDETYTIIFTDVTSWEDLKDRYNNEKPCLMKIEIDNYDQLVDNNGQTPDLTLSSEIDKRIKKLALKIDASLTRAKRSTYHLWFEQRHLDKLIANKFEILDEIRDLETTADFPASLSIGIGVGGKTLSQTEANATAALDLALGRGGDQAVIKRNKKIEYFGGRLQTVEKSNKGKSRIVGHALRQLIDQADTVFIMGHKYPDMDSFGSAIGISRLCKLVDKEPFIVINEVNEYLKTVHEQVTATGEYKFIDSESAQGLANEESLLIVCDTNIPDLVQCPELLKICEKIAVIDHHRKSRNFIENATLSYIESYASSASELVTEILQYMVSKRELTKLEAEALLAGIIVDTNNFSIKTGVRTFDAAAWLRRQSADPTEVKRFFQESWEDMRAKSEALSRTEFLGNGIAIATCPEVCDQAQILCAQIADRLLTIKGVKASFAVGRNPYEQTVISARSMGEVNVQLIMEKFNGGGHLTTAAAQVSTSIEETAAKIKEIMEEK